MNIEIDYHYGKNGKKKIRVIPIANPKDTLRIDKISAEYLKDIWLPLHQRNPLVR